MDYGKSINIQNYILANEDIAATEHLGLLPGDEYYASMDVFLDQQEKKREAYEKMKS